MKKFALGWACNLSDIFIRFPYKSCKYIYRKYKLKAEKRKIVKQIFRVGVKLIIEDIIENNNTFKLPSFQYRGGEIHYESVTGSEFEELRAKGKFARVDFLETIFTGYQLYLYIHGKRDDFLARRKFPIYISPYLRERMEDYANNGKTYC